MQVYSSSFMSNINAYTAKCESIQHMSGNQLQLKRINSWISKEIKSVIFIMPYFIAFQVGYIIQNCKDTITLFSNSYLHSTVISYTTRFPSFRVHIYVGL